METNTSKLSTAFRITTRVLQLALVGLTAYAVYQMSAGMLVNVGLPLIIAFFPDAVRYRYGYRLNSVLAAWIAFAAFLHATGSLGLYTAYPWYDQLAHGVSAAMVAGVGYAVVQVVERRRDAVEIPPRLRFVFILVFTVSFGIIWEIAEFGLGGLAAILGGEPLLTQYGLGDIVMDILFDTVGALIVGVWGTAYFEDLRRLLALNVSENS